MGIFGKKAEGGLMDAIRCDEAEYLVWKWRPSGAAGSTKKENAIRWGSSLRVKDGEVAVFVYKQKDGSMQDFIEGPFDQSIKTANFPVLSSIVGAAFGGGTPFQAEVYFINLAGIIQIKFGVPYFDVFDPRFADFAVPMSVHGTMSFKITDYKAFIKLHRLIDFDLEAFKRQIADALKKYVKGVVTNVPQDNGIPVMQMERKLLEINDIVERYLKPRMQDEFGVTVSSLDIGTIDVDKESEGYTSLMSVTKEQTANTVKAQGALNIKNMQDMQGMNAENMAETLRIQREEAQHAQRMQTDSANFAVHQLNQQTRVGLAGAEALGQMGSGGALNMGGGSGGGFNPAAMMSGIAMGGAIGQQMAGMMNNMMPNSANVAPTQMMGGMTPPPPPAVKYNVAVNGQTTGPFDMATLTQMAQNGQLTAQSQVWKQGMAAWTAAGQVAELSSLFQQVPPPPPPMSASPDVPPPPPAPPAQ